MTLKHPMDETAFVALDSVDRKALVLAENADIREYLDILVQDHLAKNPGARSIPDAVQDAAYGEIRMNYRHHVEVRPQLETAVVQGVVPGAAPPRKAIDGFRLLSLVLIVAEILVCVGLVVTSVSLVGIAAAIGSIFLSILLVVCCLLAGSGLGGLLGRALSDPAPGDFVPSPSGKTIDLVKLLVGATMIFGLLAMRFLATHDVLFPAAAAVLSVLVVLSRAVYLALHNRRDSCERLVYRVAQKDAQRDHQESFDLAMARRGGWFALLTSCLNRHLEGTRAAGALVEGSSSTISRHPTGQTRGDLPS